MKTETQEKAPRTRRATPNLAPAVVADAPLPVPIQESAGMQLLRAAVQRGASIEELDRLIALKERMEASEAKQAFMAAMVEFKRNVPTVLTNQTGTIQPKEGKAGYSYGYADLAAVCKVVIASLAAVNISHNWTHAQRDGLLHVTCNLTHELGHTISTTLMAGPDNSGGKNNIQAIGSTNTYLERYTLLAITGIAVEDGSDDDGAGGITAADRAALRTEAANMRQGRERQSPQQVASARNQSTPPPVDLLEDARKHADKGHREFGTYWRSLTEAERGKLMPEMNNLTERANAATAQSEAS